VGQVLIKKSSIGRRLSENGGQGLDLSQPGAVTRDQGPRV